MNNDIKAYQLTGKLEGGIVRIPLYKINENEVLVKVKYVSLCGSDRHLFKGEIKDQEYPIIPGHEFSGMIVEAPKDRNELIGKKVVCDIMIPCECCNICKSGDKTKCKSKKEIGFKLNGALSELIKVPISNIMILEENYDLKKACLVEPVAVGLYTEKVLELNKDMSILIMGAGSVGLTLSYILFKKGYKDITIADIKEHKLNAVKNIESTNLIDLTKTSLYRYYEKKSKPDIIIESTGSSKVMRAIFDIVKFGTKIGVLGYIKEETTIKPSTILLNGLTIKGIIGPEGVWDKAIDFLRNDNTLQDLIFTKSYPFKQAQSAFNELLNDNNNQIKIIIEMD